jgi:hypothetical protein
MKSGEVQHIWIDAQSLVDVKVEGAPRRDDARFMKPQVRVAASKPPAAPAKPAPVKK